MSDRNVEPCPTCDEPIGTHTVDLLAEHLAQVSSYDLPFEEIPETQQDLPMVLRGSVTVKAAFHSSALGSHPVLVFEFTTPEGPLPPIGLLLDDTHMRSLRQTVSAAIDAAIKAARKHR